jgi:hypothetical protein
MNDPATGQREIGFDRVQLPVSFGQCADVAIEDGAFVKQPGPFNSLVHAQTVLALSRNPPGSILHAILAE